MQELKFRIIIRNKIVGYLTFKGALAQYDFDDANDYNNLPDGVSPDLWCSKAKLEQYTGLKDKNGKEIYEGDILRYPPEDEWEKTNYACFEVFFHDGDRACVHIGFQMNRIHFHGAISGWQLIHGFVPSHVNKMEIISNVHDNPEMSEKK